MIRLRRRGKSVFLLVTDGILVCDVPNIWKPFRSLDRYFLRYVYLSYFSPLTLRRLLVNHRFAIQFLDEGGNSIHAPQSIFVIAKAVDVAATIPESESESEDWRELLHYLQRYRRIYPWLHEPRIQGRIFLRSLRGALARGVVGKIYRYFKKRGGLA